MIQVKNAVICDGTGKEPFSGELLIDGEKLAEVSPIPFGELDAEVLDARGMAVTPGFIDAHRHCDLAALYDPEFGRLELAQGITTAVMGNCGLAPAPCTEEYRDRLYDFLEPCLGTAPKNSFFPLVSEFFRALETRRYPLNLGVLGATGAITAASKGFGNVPFDRKSRHRAEIYVKDAMEAGALGLSCGIMYTPECFSKTEDFVFLAKICGEYGGYLTSHIRGEGNSLTESVKEVLEIGERAGVPVNISHLKVTGLKNHGWGIERAVGVLEEARGRGQDVTADAYPYPGGSTTILSLIPPTVMERAKGEAAAYLGTQEGIHDLAQEIGKEFSSWDNMVSSIGWERIVIGSVVREEDRIYAGLDFTAAAALSGSTETELFCRLVHENSGKIGVILMSMAQADVDRVLCLPYVSLISDALYGGGGMPHPRLYGAFPKFLREYAGEKSALSFAEAVRKMTGMPARRLGLKDRGTLEPGNYADLLVFDPAKFTDRATWQNPRQEAEGLEYVLVNGKPPQERGGKIVKK